MANAVGKSQKRKLKTSPSRRNAAAKALASGQFKSQVVKNKKRELIQKGFDDDNGSVSGWGPGIRQPSDGG